MLRLALVTTLSAITLAGCDVTTPDTDTPAMRAAPPGAEVACIDQINRDLGKLGGVLVTDSRVTNGKAEVRLASNDGQSYRCTAPVAYPIPYGVTP